MYILEKIKLNIVKQINQALGKKLIQASDLVYPPTMEMGDLSLACFTVAKKLNKSPAEVAQWLNSEIKNDSIIVASKAVGPYLNFTIHKSYLTQEVIKQINKAEDEYGCNKTGQEKKVMIEYSNVNTHKQYHVGHLRNLCYGDAINRILVANGYKTIPVSYINDFGIHVAKTLWAFEEFYKNNKLPKNKPAYANPPAGRAGASAGKGAFLGSVYARAVEEIEKSPTAKGLVTMLMKKIETRKGEEYQLWQKTRQWSIAQFDQIYQQMSIKFKHIFYENEFVNQGRKMIEDLYKKKFLEKSQGAIIANLEKYNLGILLFLRSDGTTLYPVADLPLAIEKIKKYKLDKSIYVVDVRQGLYFKQLFKILELILQDTRCPIGHRVSKLPELIHLGYEFVKLPKGMISSRTGQVITYEDLRELAIKRAIKETKERHNKWSAKKIEQVAQKLVNGAMKFEMVKVGADQVITFDINQALRFEGFTSAYLQYTYARINSILEKADGRRQTAEIDFANLKEEKEYELVMKMAKYPEVVQKAGESYDSSEVAKYLFDLAQLFNDYYHSVPVLKAETEIRQARLVLIKSVNQVINNGLALLGIDVLAEM